MTTDNDFNKWHKGSPEHGQDVLVLCSYTVGKYELRYIAHCIYIEEHSENPAEPWLPYNYYTGDYKNVDELEDGYIPWGFYEIVESREEYCCAIRITDKIIGWCETPSMYGEDEKKM